MKTPHLNRSRVKQTALELAKPRINGFGKPRFTRVSRKFLERIDALTLAAIRAEISRHPSIGKTLM